MSDWGGTQYDLCSGPAPLRCVFFVCGRKKKIAPNSVLLVYLAVALAVNLVHPSDLIYVPLILAVSFALYYIGFWGAGDGKLFFCSAVYLLPFTGDKLYYLALNLFLSVSLCYIALFFMFLYGAEKNILRILRDAGKKTLSANTMLRLLLSLAVLLSASSFAGCVGCVRLPVILLYVLSSLLPAKFSLGVFLILLPLQLLYPLPFWDYIMLLLPALLFAFFFNLYSALGAASAYREKKMVFAPFLFASSLLIMLLP
jgi:Flp pilus assembly protein protease CpaA